MDMASDQAVNTQEKPQAAKGRSIVEMRGVTKVFYRGKEPLPVLDGHRPRRPRGRRSRR